MYIYIYIYMYIGASSGRFFFLRNFVEDPVLSATVAYSAEGGAVGGGCSGTG